MAGYPLTAKRLAGLTINQADHYREHGTISEVEYGAVRRAWAILTPYPDSHLCIGWDKPSDDPRVEQLAQDIITQLNPDECPNCDCTAYAPCSRPNCPHHE